MRMRAVASLLLISALTVGLPSRGDAVEWREEPHSRVRLVAAGAVNADMLAQRAQLRDPVLLAGVEIRLDPGWKTYWRAPGDGIAPRFVWKSAENLAAAQVLWPVPSHFRDAAGQYNGYADRVLFPVLVVPRNPGAPVSLDLTLEYAICKDICIPVTEQLSARLSAQKTDATRAVLQALRETPVRADQDGHCGDLAFESVRADLGGEQPELEIKIAHASGAAPNNLFAEASTGQFMAHPERRARSENLSVFQLDLTAGGDPRALAGKTLTFTAVGASESCEMAWTVK